MGPRHSYLRGTTRLMRWPYGERYSYPLQSLFSDWRRTVSSKFFDTQVPSIFTEELVLPCHACCVLSRLRCNGHSLLLGSYLSRIGRIGNPSCSTDGHSSQDTSHLILHCPATDSLRHSLFGNSLSLYYLWSRPWGVAGLLGLHCFPPCPLSLGRGWIKTTTADAVLKILKQVYLRQVELQAAKRLSFVTRISGASKIVTSIL